MHKTTYLWQNKNWPHLSYKLEALSALLAQVHHTQGHLLGRMRDLGFDLREQASLEALSEEVIKTSEIEGERLDLETVRSSLARRLGINIGALSPENRQVEGVVNLVLDATTHFDQKLTTKRLFGWHTDLFPNNSSSMTPIQTGAWRNDAFGPMQVVSGPLNHHKVHFEAPPASVLEKEMSQFLDWFNTSDNNDPLIKAGLAHLWFVTIHPFEDGNGRIARAIGDMALARAEQSAQRFYSLSAQIQRERKDYYNILEHTQKGSLDVSKWLEWFLACLLRAMQGAELKLAAVLAKARFWQHWAGTALNDRQIKVINRLLDGFEGKLNNRKWASIAKCSSDSALRDISDLLDKGILIKADAGGRSTSYELQYPINT